MYRQENKVYMAFDTLYIYENIDTNFISDFLLQNTLKLLKNILEVIVQ